MRRHLPSVLIGLGFFLLTAALMLRFYGYSQLAVAQKDPFVITEMSAPNATVFDPSQQKVVTTSLTVAQKTAGDIAAAKNAPSGVVVWFTTTTERAAGAIIQQSMERTAFDASSGQIKPCCGSFAQVINQAISADKRKGLLLTFPFDTQKHSYQVWDNTLGATVTASFKGTTHIDGLGVYRFEADVPETVVGTSTVPGRTVGLAKVSTVPVDQSYEVTRQLYVEPRTGAIINDVQDIKDALTRNGADVRTLMSGVLSYTDAQVKTNVKTYGARAATLQRVRATLPLIGLVLGALCVVAGGLLLRRRRQA